MEQSITILKHPVLKSSSDYELLRQKGMEYIQQLGSRLWTDYNIHDPGITLLELLCYGITDLGYRTSLDIKDLLAVKVNEIPDHNRQGFYTAREILTVNPWTNRDYRKLLIDIDGIKNAWLTCKQCPCDDLYLYANCKKSELQYDPTEHIIIIKGMYDVKLEFEDEERTGNLNSGKISYNFSFMNGAVLTTATIEMRLSSWKKIEENKNFFEQFRQPESELVKVTVSFISGTKDDNVDIPANELGSRLRKPVYATMQVEFKPDKNVASTVTLVFEDIPLTVWFRSDSDRKAMPLASLKAAIEDSSSGGIMGKYMEKIKKADEIIAKTTQVLHNHRNLAEDYCSIGAVETEDIAVCADMEVEADADIEEVLAEAYYLIDQYFSPDIKFYSLQQLLDEGVTVDEIFDGPKLANGFIKNDQLDSTHLKKVLYTSDIINLLMDIPGVKAVKNLVLVRYSDEGFLVENQSWEMEVTLNRQPRLYTEATKFLVYKNGLPFLADRLELADTLQVIRGRNAQPKFSVLENDLPVPTGKWYDLREYYPLQYSLPLTYGVGYEGLPSPVSEKRKAQAKQLKTYLLFYEQLLVNYLEQLAHVKDLFAIDQTVVHTYFSRWIANTEIRGVDEIYNGLTPSVLQDLTETGVIFSDRRSRFLDHLLARFAEQFSDYALMLYSFSESKEVADDKLIKDKISFLKDYPFMSYNKARSFNYKDSGKVCSGENIAGLALRIRRLLGIPEFTGYFELYEEKDVDGKFFERRWRLIDEKRKIYLSSSTRYTDTLLSQSEAKAKKEISEVRKSIADPSKYEIKKVKKWVVNLLDGNGEIIATRKQPFETKAAAEAARDEIIEFAKKIFAAEKIFIVEHLLLRPRNKPGGAIAEGDALLPICIPGDCNLCGEEDPYSFRLTIVLNGEEGIANKGIPFRRFAEKTIRMEVPAHLGVKVCWVSKEQLIEFEKVYCEWLQELSKEEPDPVLLSNKLKALITVFIDLKNVYPQATLHDCVDGDDENRVYLNQTII